MRENGRFRAKNKEKGDSCESPFCVATKKLIESETTSKQQFLGWIFDFCGVSQSKNGVSVVEWGVPWRKSGVSEENSSEFRFEVALSAPSRKFRSSAIQKWSESEKVRFSYEQIVSMSKL